VKLAKKPERPKKYAVKLKQNREERDKQFTNSKVKTKKRPHKYAAFIYDDFILDQVQPAEKFLAV
jgi:hypothetical protein